MLLADSHNVVFEHGTEKDTTIEFATIAKRSVYYIVIHGTTGNFSEDLNSLDFTPYLTKVHTAYSEGRYQQVWTSKDCLKFIFNKILVLLHLVVCKTTKQHDIPHR